MLEDCEHELIKENGFQVCVLCGECLDIIYSDKTNEYKNEYFTMKEAVSLRHHEVVGKGLPTRTTFSSNDEKWVRLKKLNNQTTDGNIQRTGKVLPIINVVASQLQSPRYIKDSVRMLYEKIIKVRKKFNIEYEYEGFIGACFIMIYQRYNLPLDKEKLCEYLGISIGNLFIFLERIYKLIKE